MTDDRGEGNLSAERYDDGLYTYRVEWSPEDDEYVGLVAEFPSLSHLAATEAEALAGIKALVVDVVADILAARK